MLGLMSSFVGREHELALLESELARVREQREGRLLVLRGRRRVGKSRLVEEFLTRSGAPAVFFSATRGRPPERERSLFLSAVRESRLPARDLIEGGVGAQSWDGALSVAVSSPESPEPVVIVIDEFPYLVESDAEVEGAFQTAWDRLLSRMPVMLVLVGSDLSLMEALTTYGRPLYDRPTRVLRLDPLNPDATQAMTGLGPADALDAHLVLGGFPLLARSWTGATDVLSYLAEALRDPTAPVLVHGERVVAAEFPPEARARAVLRAIGAGERTFSKIGALSATPRQSLERALALLIEKRVIVKESPTALRATHETRYRVADPALRFWLRFLEDGVDEVERGRTDLLMGRIRRAWPSYRGRAIEPLVREGLERLLPDARLAGARRVGAYWTRSGDVEIDLVGVDDLDRPSSIPFIGSVKWRESEPLTRRDLAALAGARPRVPGATEATSLVGVSRTGAAAEGFDAIFGADQLLEAWRP